MSVQSRRVAALLDDNALEDALEQVKIAVKATPADHDSRHLYIDLLILAGDYGRADQQCDLASKFQPTDAVGFAILRHQIRAMSARQAWFDAGGVPDFPGGPTELDQIALKLGMALREQSFDQASDLLAQLEEARGPHPMIWNGNACADLRDLDDRIPHALEVLTTGGAYLWVDFRKIETVSVEPIVRSRDIAFRPAELTLIGGATASVLLPAVYHSTANKPAWQLARETEWVDLAPGLVMGCGQKCYLVGEEIQSLHDLTELHADEALEQRQTANG
jgi:type VI secretion system protein ImpE